MELIWLVLSLLVLDLAAYLFAVDTRPGFQHSAHPGLRPWRGHHVRPGSRRPLRPGSRHPVSR
jgi:hypothetical protein